MSWTACIKQFKANWVTLLLIGLIVYLWFRPPAFVSDLNEPLNDFQFITLDGREGSMQSLRGKVVLVNFWATWCPYCRHEMPAMEKFYKDHQAKGFEILAISMDDTATVASDFMQAEGYTFPSLMLTPEQRAVFGEISRLPTSFVIDRHGHLRHKISGQVHYGRMEDLILPLLNSK